MLNTIHVVKSDLFYDDKYAIYWGVEDTVEGGEYICCVYGFENAVRVANGIAHEQAEYVVHPSP